MRVIQSKIRPPDPQARVVDRPRLADLIAELEELYGIVWVTGSAGAGKTTAVLESVRRTGRPLAWLTLDTTERAPGRLLMYLEESLARVLPDLPPVATQALAADIAHVEAAGLLAEAVGTREVTLVVDELEKIADSDSARATLAAFLRYASPTLHSVLISRRPVQLRLGSARDLGGVGTVGEAHLAFTVDEAAEALRLVGHDAPDAHSAVEATGGWVAGVLFDAWRSPSHVHGAGGEADALNSYLSSEIMSDLPERERDFLVVTSLLEEVVPSDAQALGQEQAAESMAALRALHLPLSFSTDRLAMRCHPRFREYLQARLRSSEGYDVAALRRAHGRLLIEEGRHEDAVDALLEGGDVAAAESAAEATVTAVLRRLDFPVVKRWLLAFTREGITRSEQLTLAELLLAIESEEWVVAASCADRLFAMTRKRSPEPLEPSVAVAIASSYYLMSRIDDALDVLDDAVESPQTEAMRFAIRVDLVQEPTHYRERPPNCGEAVDGLLARVDLAHGRFDRLLEPSSQPWAAAHSNRIAALRALGRLDEALELFRDSSLSGWTMIRVYVELMADLNQPAKAWAELRAGRELLARSGAGFMMFGNLLEASLELRFGGDTVKAAAALERVEAEPTAYRRLRIVEQLELWRGLIALLDGEDEEAATRLRSAVALMLDWDRLLYLPTAATYLSEAEWRLGNEDAADEAADVALTAARRQGSNHVLLQALKEFPAVASRRLDAEREADSAWHDLGRTLLSEGAIATPRLIARACVLEFGEPLIVIDGERVQPKLTKSVELLAYLAAQPNQAATKNEVLQSLFEGRTDDSARSYLRQALNRLRQALPPDAPLRVEGDSVSWDGGTLTSESVELQRELRQAAHFRGRDRLDAALAALRVFESGEYLADARSAWADTRREDLNELLTDTRLAAAEAAFDIGDYRRADELGKQVLDADPYRESAWRLSMKVASAMGDDDRVIARYRACERSLATVSVPPAPSTLQLLSRLRR